jgi:DNA-directed RNA polymerase specialized sigma24 family protein
MNCRECEDLLQRRLDGAGAPPPPELAAHLAGCPACRAVHAAAARLLDGLQARPRPAPPPAFAARVAAAVLKDRADRRRRVRRRLSYTAALAATVLLVLLAGYYWAPPAAPTPHPPGPVAEHKPRDAAPPAPQPPAPEAPAPAPRKETAEEPRRALAALTGRLADTTRDHALVLWSATAPLEPVPLPPMADLDAPEPLRQAGQEVSESVQTVTRSARRALDYFARELPALDVPPATP